jgi:endonuclease III
MENRSELNPRAKQRLRQLGNLLHHAYAAPERDLGNKADPLDEAIYITLTLQTDLARAALSWRRLKAAFPRWDAAETARAAQIATVIRDGGLQHQKARSIKRLLAHVRRFANELSLRRLRDMSDADAERVLVSLPGFSWKTARCVMLYSLNRDTFPVDSNTFRILKRVGILAPSAVYRRRSLHDALQKAVSPTERRAFHVNLVVHGQRTCLPRAPRCDDCIARGCCASAAAR